MISIHCSEQPFIHLLVILQVTFYDISDTQSISHGLAISELEEFLELLLSALKNKVGSRVNVRSIADSGFQDFDVVGRDAIREGENFGDTFRDGDLVNLKIWIGRNDRTSGEIDTLSRQVATEATLLSLETLTKPA